LSVKDANGCIGTATTILNRVVETIPELESPPTVAGCAPLEVSFDYLMDYLDESYAVFWDFGDGAVDSGLLISHIYQEPGNYGLGLQITTPSGCDTILIYENTILVEAPPIAGFEYSPGVVNKMETIQFKDLSERAVSWNWNFGDGGLSVDRDPVWVFQHAENYTVGLTVEDQYGCQDSTSLPLEVRPVVNIYVPNAFSPNDDGINDEFRTYPSCPLEEFQLKVFDRWGAQLFESKDTEEGWSGIHKNELFDPGVFTWVVTFRLREQVHMMRGDVTLLR
jgi:gliding motility-associated-like protein